jgi:uncharacterized protein (TIGR03437 family)
LFLENFVNSKTRRTTALVSEVRFSGLSGAKLSTVRVRFKELQIMKILITICGLVALSLAQAQNEIVSAGYDIPAYPAFAPGQVITLFVRGLTVADAFAEGTLIPTTLAGITVRVKTIIPNYPDRLPIFSVKSYALLTHVTVQIPTETTCLVTGNIPDECTTQAELESPPGIVLTVEQGGTPGKDFPIIVNGVNGVKPHILNACDTVFGTIGGICNSFITHADGSLIGSGCANPGETIVIYAVGLGGDTTIRLKTGEVAPSSPPARYVGDYFLTVSFRVNGPPSSPGPPVTWVPVPQWFYAEYVGLVPGFVGLYQINFKVPVALPPNVLYGYGANMRIAIGAGSTPTSPADGDTFVDVCVQVRIPAKANTDSEGNANGIPGRRRTVLGA